MRILSLIIAATFFLVSCDGAESSKTKPTNENNENNTTQEEVKADQTKAITNDDNGLLQLNNGEKWLANPETSEGMLMMQILIKGFYDTSEDNRNYAEFTGELQYQCNYIIKNCSMKGDSHDQLHEVLHPILEEVKLAQNAASYEDADKSIQKVNELLTQYFLYFEVKEAV